MPELKLRDLHFPELRLPEMTRDDIAKALGEARKELVEVRKDLNEFRRDFEMPRVELTKVELPKADEVVREAREIARDARGAAASVGKDVAKNARQAGKTVGKNAKDAAQAAGLVKRPSRLPFVLAGIVTLGVVGWALINSPGLKTRIREAAEQAREKMAERRAAWDDDAEPHAFDAAVPVPIEPSAYADAISTTDSPFAEPPTDLPEGFGQDNGTNSIESDDKALA